MYGKQSPRKQIRNAAVAGKNNKAARGATRAVRATNTGKRQGAAMRIKPKMGY